MKNKDNRFIDTVIIAVTILAVIAFCRTAWSAEIVNSERLADAIYLAEGGDIAKPYGIMRDYCKRGDPDGQCRKGCIQTIDKWKQRLVYTDSNDFIRQFAEIYAPTKGDLREAERRLNKHWPKNVLHFYNKGT